MCNDYIDSMMCSLRLDSLFPPAGLLRLNSPSDGNKVQDEPAETNSPGLPPPYKSKTSLHEVLHIKNCPPVPSSPPLGPPPGAHSGILTARSPWIWSPVRSYGLGVVRTCS